MYAIGELHDNIYSKMINLSFLNFYQLGYVHNNKKNINIYYVDI